MEKNCNVRALLEQHAGHDVLLLSEYAMAERRGDDLVDDHTGDVLIEGYAAFERFDPPFGDE